jgi:hypothetical protein
MILNAMDMTHLKINKSHYHPNTHRNVLLPYLTAFTLVFYLKNPLMALPALMEYTRLYRVKQRKFIPYSGASQ